MPSFSMISNSSTILSYASKSESNKFLVRLELNLNWFPDSIMFEELICD